MSLDESMPSSKTLKPPLFNDSDDEDRDPAIVTPNHEGRIAVGTKVYGTRKGYVVDYDEDDRLYTVGYLDGFLADYTEVELQKILRGEPGIPVSQARQAADSDDDSDSDIDLFYATKKPVAKRKLQEFETKRQPQKNRKCRKLKHRLIQEPIPEPVLTIGDRITVFWDGEGEFFDGTVTDVLEKGKGKFLYYILYDEDTDDNHEYLNLDTFDAAHWRKLPPLDMTKEYETGTQVYKYFSGYGWYKGVIIDIDKRGHYLVEYEDGDRAWFPPDSPEIHSIVLKYEQSFVTYNSKK